MSVNIGFIFNTSFMTYLEESYLTQVEYGFNYHDVEIFDTAGQEEFMQFRDTSMRQGDAFLLMFAINSLSSWVHLKELRTKIVREKEDDSMIPMVVVANKRVSTVLTMKYSCIEFS